MTAARRQTLAAALALFAWLLIIATLGMFLAFPCYGADVTRVDIVYSDGTRQTLIAATQPATRPTTEPTPTTQVAAPDARPFVGLNLDGVSSSSPAPVLYADVMKYARPFGTYARPEDQAAPKDARGWPTSDTSGVVVFVDRPNASGTYTLSYPGSAKVTLANSGTSSLSAAYDPATDTTTGTITVTGNSLWLKFTGGAVHDVKVFAPGAVDGWKFHPQVLAALSYAGGTRYMDLMGTNNSQVSRWSDRTPVGAATYNRPAGLPYEDLIDLQNAVAALTNSPFAAWYCVPVKADDDFARQFGALLASRVAPGLPVYVQYGNELWNSAANFHDSYQYNLDAAQAEVKAGDRTLNDNGADTNIYQWSWKREAKRVIEIRRLFPADPRFRFIVESQHNYGGRGDEARQSRLQLEYVAKYFGPPADYFYAIASAPYSGAGSAASTQPALTPQQYAQAVYDRSGNSWDAGSAARLALARKYRVRYVAYEGNVAGDWGFANMAALIAGQGEPLVGQASDAYLHNWFSHGGDEFFWFNGWSRWGPIFVWGAAPDAQHLDAPKFQSLVRVQRELAAGGRP